MQTEVEKVELSLLNDNVGMLFAEENYAKMSFLRFPRQTEYRYVCVYTE